MNPFSTYLLDLRRRHRVSQKELAKKIGYEQGFISGLEIGKKNPPNEEFINKLIEALNLDETEQAALRRAVEESQRKYMLPGNASAEVFKMVKKLWHEIDNLHPSQIRIINEVLQLSDQYRTANGSRYDQTPLKGQRKEAHT